MIYCRGPTECSPALSLIGGVYICARALLDKNVIGFGSGGGGFFTRSNYFYLPSLRSEDEGAGESAPCGSLPPLLTSQGLIDCFKYEIKTTNKRRLRYRIAARSLSNMLT